MDARTVNLVHSKPNIINSPRSRTTEAVNGVMTLSRLAEFRAAEKALQEQLAQLEALKNDAGLKKEIEFEEKLQALMKTYGKIFGTSSPSLTPTLRRQRGICAQAAQGAGA